jgi:tRNA dimethylallyltransferase
MLIITGQTATGKTQLALQYAQKYNGELINCDSRQIYQDLDLVTGKDLEEKKFYRLEKINQFQIGYYLLSYAKTPIPVWLYDVVAINHYFSSFDYRQLALKVITNIIARKKTPILIGGSYLYLYHLLYQINTIRFHRILL